MAALAFLAKARGDEVSGCDAYPSSRTRWLESHGIPFSEGHSPGHLAGVDEIIVTPAVSSDSPEYLAAKEMERSGLSRVRYRGEMLAEIVSSRESIAVCGTHGKTTTSTFIAKLLSALGEKTVWAIGGESGSFPVAGSANCSADEGVLVVEADESDGTLALYSASLLVVTNCEYDHPDHFKTVDEYVDCYNHARRKARDVIEVESLDINRYLNAAGFSFLASLPPHNIRNACAAVEVAVKRGHSLDAISSVLPQIVSVLPDRRFQKIWPAGDDGDSSSGTVIADYAHHPTEMKCAIEMARRICRGKLRVLFQPHRFSRTKALLADFPNAFALADEVVLCPTYTAFEQPVEGGDVADLYACCRNKVSCRIMLARNCLEAWKHAYFESDSGDVTLLLGAGDIIKVAGDVVRDCSRGRARSQKVPLSEYSFFRTGGVSVTGGPRRVAGMGSNTWVSDLTTDLEYFRLPQPETRRVFGQDGACVVQAGMPGSMLKIPWMAGIPGTVGGWVKMNAGAFGHSISELVLRVKVSGRWMGKSECGFAYRKSVINGVIEEVELSCAGFAEEEDVFLKRRKAFPPRTCGSVFKNPPGDFAGRLLEAAGVKNITVGGARVWREHANVIVAGEGATSSDILALARLMREKVRFMFGVLLDSEICGLDF